MKQLARCLWPTWYAVRDLRADMRYGFNYLNRKANRQMAQLRQDVIDILAKIDAATNAVGARIAALVAASSGLTADEKAALQAEIDKLTALASDPNNPVPSP